MNRLRWVEPIEYMNNERSANKQWFRTYRPYTTGEDGWFWLGSSWNYRWALLVKKSGIADGKGDALCEIGGVNEIWTNTMAKKDTSTYFQIPALRDQGFTVSPS